MHSAGPRHNHKRESVALGRLAVYPLCSRNIKEWCKAISYCSLTLGGSSIPLDRLRRSLSARWIASERIINTCRASGGLLALISVGFPPICLLLFPPTMAAVIRVIERWGWFVSPVAPSRRRTGLRPLYAAPVFFLVTILPPTIFFVMMLLGLALEPLVLLYVHLRGATHFSQRQQEDIGMTLVGIALLLLWALLYCGLQALALERITGRRHRSLFLEMWVWTCVMLGAARFETSKVYWSQSSAIPLQPLWPIIGEWVLAMIIFSRLGAIFGRWLADSNKASNPDSPTSP